MFNLEQGVSNILTVYERATLSDKMSGMGWYPYANFYAMTIGRKFDIPTATVCGVISALSPNNKWERNIIDAEKLIIEHLGGPEAKVCTYGLNKQKGLEILKGAEISTVLKGDKTFSFFNNIYQPENPDFVTIDFHAYDIYRFENVKKGLSSKTYKEVSMAYREAAKQIGLVPNQLQATTWVTWRQNKHLWT